MSGQAFKDMGKAMTDANARAKAQGAARRLAEAAAEARELERIRGEQAALTLHDADLPRVEGHVRCVSETDAGVTIGGWWIPLGCVAAVHLPSRLGDSEGCVGAWHGEGRRDEQIPGQQPIEGIT